MISPIPTNYAAQAAYNKNNNSSQQAFGILVPTSLTRMGSRTAEVTDLASELYDICADGKFFTKIQKAAAKRLFVREHLRVMDGKVLPGVITDNAGNVLVRGIEIDPAGKVRYQTDAGWRTLTGKNASVENGDIFEAQGLVATRLNKAQLLKETMAPTTKPNPVLPTTAAHTTRIKNLVGCMVEPQAC